MVASFFSNLRSPKTDSTSLIRRVKSSQFCHARRRIFNSLAGFPNEICLEGQTFWPMSTCKVICFKLIVGHPKNMQNKSEQIEYISRSSSCSCWGMVQIHILSTTFRKFITVVHFTLVWRLCPSTSTWGWVSWKPLHQPSTSWDVM